MLGDLDFQAIKAKAENLLSREDIASREELDRFLYSLHPADIATLIGELGLERSRKIIELLKGEQLALVMAELYKMDRLDILRELIDALPRDKLKSALSEMPYDDVTDILADLGEKGNELFKLLEREDAEEVRELLYYPEESAGGIMTTEFIAFPRDMTVREAMDELREKASEVEIIYYIYVVDEDGKLSGVLSLRDLLTSPPDLRLSEIMNPNVIKVNLDTDQEEVARVVSKYDLLAVPVVDRAGRLVGIVTFDDVIDIIEEEASEDIYKMVGSLDEGAEISSLKIVKLRLPWLMVSLAGESISANVIRSFDAIIKVVVSLAWFIPMIMALGGNAGTQAAAIVIRGIATGEVNTEKLKKLLLREVKVGAIMGAISGLVVGGVGISLHHDYLVGVVVAISMVVAIAVAAGIGALIPLMFDKLGVDPALASGPFITTINDITGLLIYFSLAFVFLHVLGWEG